MCSKLFFFVSCLTLILAQGDYGPCSYGLDNCSCKFGEESQGICWDKIVASPGICKRRSCKAGWTCACGGRTHLCGVVKKTVTVLKNPRDKAQKTAECISKSTSLVSGERHMLGKFKVFLSRAGVAANACNEVAWWLDGRLHGFHYKENDMTKVKIDDALNARQEHSLLELKADSLLAFRIKNGSYYCFKHYAEMELYGISISTKNTRVSVHYSRKPVAEWFMPSYKLTPDKIGKDEKADASTFLPLRKTMLTTSEAIEPGKDYWTPPTTQTKDTRIGDWYYRIQLSNPIISV